MSKTKFNKSIFFLDSNGTKRFLFKCVNYSDNDDLKFIFNFPKKGKSVIFSTDDNCYPDNIEIRSYAELSYHQDGSLLWKFPKRKGGQPQKYHNPHGVWSRRTALSNIKLWEPIIQGNIIRYQDCINEETNESEEIIDCKEIFDNTPFEYYLHLGQLVCANPPNNKHGEYIHRINGVTEKLDMILWFRKSEFKGQSFLHGNTPAINDNNRIKIIEPNFLIDQSGAFEIDLGILNNTEWNGDIVDENMNLNMIVLRNIDSKVLICKAYLKDNPYINQIKELVGYNKGFAISPNFRNKKLNIRMVGVIEKENELDLFSIGTL